jgi:cell division protein FtsQ
MRSRRIEVQRDAGRRRLRRVTVAACVASALVLGYGATRTPLLDVDHVRVRGGEHVDADTLVAAAGVHRGATMVGVDPGAAARRVEAVPWVDEARVERSWPGTVRIVVTERSPVAVVEATDTLSAVVDVTGRVVDMSDAPPGGLLALTGVRGRIAEGEVLPRAARDALAVVGTLRERVPQGALAVSTELEVTIFGGGRVRFGSTDRLDEKVVAVETVLANVELACLEVLDVRVPANPALTRHQGCP